MNKINFSLIFHMHQPIGNFKQIFDLAANRAYLPLLKILYANPEIKFALHISGPLWEYFSDAYPEIFKILIEMQQREQMEILGGGFYEPILTAIPTRDAIEQVEWLSDYLEDQILVRPNGIWLSERIWEPKLPSILNEAGIIYTAVDDYHFKTVGLTGDELFGYYFTEDEGNKLILIPIAEKLRYLMPFRPVSDTIEHLCSVASKGNDRWIVFGDDGEKFGLWPGTYQWVWQEGWFNNFIDELKNNNDWINLVTPTEMIDKFNPLGRVYIPTTSYFEMGEWSLPVKASIKLNKLVSLFKQNNQFEMIQPFLRGAYWKNFLSKYEESNWMHKRMLHVSNRFHLEASSLEEEIQEEVERSLFSSQCNCGYWHGVFGGLYLPHLRKAIWENLIKIEYYLGQIKELPLLRISIVTVTMK